MYSQYCNNINNFYCWYIFSTNVPTPYMAFPLVNALYVLYICYKRVARIRGVFLEYLHRPIQNAFEKV